MEDLQQEEASAVIKAEAIIDRYVKAKEREISDASRTIAAIVSAAISGFLAYHVGFTGLGAYTPLWSALIGFVVGAMAGERVAFVTLGVVASYFLTKGQCS